MPEQSAGSSLKGDTVCVVTPVPLWRDSRTLKQVSSLRRSGAGVIAIAGGERAPEDLANPRDAASRPGIPGQSAPTARLWSWVRSTQAPAIVVAPFFAAWLCLFFVRTVRVALKVPDASLFILHGVTSYPTYALSGRRAPFIYDIHDFYCGVEPESEIGTFERSFLRPFLRFVEGKCIARAAETVTVSSGLADLIERSYGRRPIVVRNCHDIRLDTEPAEDIRAKLGLKKNDFLIVIIGNRKEGQRFDSLLAALGRSSDTTHVALIGRGYEILAPQIEAAGLGGRVHVVGALPPWSIVPSVRSADLAALPYYGRSENYSYSLPNGFFQSAGAGLPLLYPDLPEMRALAERYDMGLAVDWASPGDIAAKLAQFRKNRDLAARLRGNAAVASQDLSWKHEEERWLETVLSAISSRATHAP